MARKWKEIRRNSNGSRTEKVRYGDGSGRDTTFRSGVFGRNVEKVRTYPAKKTSWW